MKKLGKSFSFLTKIMLVIGLLISNLSSLSVVFAYEATGAVQITVVDEKLNIIDSGDAIHLKIKIAAFPARKEIAIDKVRQVILSDLNGKKE